MTMNESTWRKVVLAWLVLLTIAVAGQIMTTLKNNEHIEHDTATINRTFAEFDRRIKAADAQNKALEARVAAFEARVRATEGAINTVYEAQQKKGVTKR